MAHIRVALGDPGRLSYLNYVNRLGEFGQFLASR